MYIFSLVGFVFVWAMISSISLFFFFFFSFELQSCQFTKLLRPCLNLPPCLTMLFLLLMKTFLEKVSGGRIALQLRMSVPPCLTLMGGVGKATRSWGCYSWLSVRRRGLVGREGTLGAWTGRVCFPSRLLLSPRLLAPVMGATLLRQTPLLCQFLP